MLKRLVASVRYRSRSFWYRAKSDYLVLRWFSGRPPRRLDPEIGSFFDTRGRVQVDLDQFRHTPRTAVLLAWGQSNIANECDPTGCIEPNPNVFNFNLFDGQCYRAQEPLLGPTGNRSNLLPRLANLLIARGCYNQVLLIPIGHGGSFVGEWLPDGRVGPRLTEVLQQLKKTNISVTHGLWQQGESEAAATQPDGESWMRDFAAMVRHSRQLGLTAPIYVAQCTVCRMSPN